MYRRVRRNDGFSLVELAVAMTIIGLVSAVVLQSYRYYVTYKMFNTSESNKIAISTALNNHIFNFGYLPCPAGRTIPPGDPRAGMQAGTGIASTTVGADSCEAWVKAHTTLPYCETNPSSSQYGICIVAGEKNPAGRTDAGLSATRDPVLIGTIPYFDLGLSLRQAMDGWGNRFVYAVSFYETQKAAVDANGRDLLGSIGIKYINRNDETTPGLMTALKNKAYSGSYVGGYPFVFFSAGANGKGAYSYDGKLAAPCTGQGWDILNCNYETSTATSKVYFVLPMTSSTDPTGAIYSTAPGVDYYDDWAMQTDISVDRDNWTYTGANALMNKNSGGVAIGNGGLATVSQKIPALELPPMTQAESYKLDVTGEIRAQQLLADSICDENGINCFPHSFLADTACPSGGIVTGIANGKLICTQSADLSALTGSSACTAGKLLVGFELSGKTKVKLMCQDY